MVQVSTEPQTGAEQAEQWCFTDDGTKFLITNHTLYKTQVGKLPPQKFIVMHELSYHQLLLEYGLVKASLKKVELRMISHFYMSSMQLLWPTVGSDDSESMDSDGSSMSGAEEMLKIISKPNKCITSHRKLIMVDGQKVPYTYQYFTTPYGQKAVSICVFDRSQAVEYGVLLFVDDQLKERIDWWKTISERA